MFFSQRVTSLPGPVDLSGRTALVIGATAGIGASLARQLAAAGATVIINGRDPDKLERSRVELDQIAPGRIHTALADLADLASVRGATETLRACHPRLDIVIANASVMMVGLDRQFTRDGFEMTFGVNHLGNAAFLLGLEQSIHAAAAARVVIVSSEAHRRAQGLPMDDLMGDRDFNALRAYARSKLANLLFARQLAQRWPDVAIHAAHPGGVWTDMMRGVTDRVLLYRIIVRLMRSQLLTPDEAAKGILRIAVDPELTDPSGSYFELGRREAPGKLADDADLGRQLFAATERLLQTS